MGYFFRGIISTSSIVDFCKIKYKNLHLIQLHHNLVTIPLTDELFDEINDGQGIPIKNYEYLTDRLGIFCSDISRFEKVAYIEADYFDGMGFQSGIVWDKGLVIFEEILNDNSINKVLELFGVENDNSKDEFDTVGLGRHRNIRDWIDQEHIL